MIKNIYFVTPILLVIGSVCMGENMSKYSNRMIGLIDKKSPLPLIVHSDEKDKAGNPLVEFAASDLQRYLARVTGKTLELGEERPNETCIHIGQTRYVKALRLGLEHLDYDGFIVCTRLRGNVPQLIIAGRTPYGTYLGVNYFLRAYVGVQWLFPGKLGEVVPRKPEISIPAELDDKQEPDFIKRTHSYERNQYWGIFKLRSLLNSAGCEPDETNPHPKFTPGWVDRTRVSHFFHEVIPPSMHAAHPEYFPLINGKRFEPKHPNIGWQPCLSNPEVVARFIKAAQEYFDESPDHLCYSLAENDSGGYCECEKCKAMDYPKAKKWATDLCENYADRSWRFYAQVADVIAKSHPGRYLGVYSYLWSNEPPSDPTIKIPNNMIVRKTFPHESDLDRFERWSELGLSFGGHEYMYDMGFHEFRHYPHQMADEIRARYRRGMKSIGCEIYSRASKCAPKIWILSRLLWDIREDVDELMKEYCQYAYGAASGPMLDFWNRWEEIYMRLGEPARRIFYTNAMLEDQQLKNMTVEDVKYLSGKIKKARSLADSDDDKARVEMVALEYERSETYISIILATRSAKEHVNDYGDMDSIIAQMVHLYALHRQQEEAWPFKRVPELGNCGYRGDIWKLGNWTRIPHNLEQCQDELAQEITERLSQTKKTSETAAFWKETSQNTPQIAKYAATQIYYLAHPERENLIKNPLLKRNKNTVENWSTARPKSTYALDERPSNMFADANHKNAVGFKGFFFSDRLYQDVSIESGKRYRAEISVLNHVRNDQRTSWGDLAEAGLKITWLNGGKPIPDQNTKQAYTKKNAPDWKELSLTVTAPEHADAARIEIYMLSYLDDETVFFKSPVFECISK